jgi:hypothetical protein
MDAVWLILSGAYVGQELSAEFGQLPPAFLPVGNQRLYELQLARISGGPVYLTLPEDFRLPPTDASRLHDLDVTILGTPPGLTLGQAVMWALNYIGIGQTPVHILHGDTLVDGVALDRTDVIAAADTSDGYSWAEIDLIDARVVSLTTVEGGSTGGRHKPVACGYFAFARSMSLLRCLTRANGDFIAGLNRYCAEHEVGTTSVMAWLDFGHVQTFFRSRRDITTARAFNSLRIDSCVARKWSQDGTKMRAEARWLAGVPPSLRPYCVRLIDSGEDASGTSFYETEYEYLPTVAELFVYGLNPRTTWTAIMASCTEFLQLCAAFPGPPSVESSLMALTKIKTASRLTQFARSSGFDIHAETHLGGRPLPSLASIADRLAAVLATSPGGTQSVMHGDFCFSNILFNARTRRIRVIDPRGHVEAGVPTIYGDSRYDLAKLAHSIVGRYDQIVAGRYASDRRGHEFDIAFEALPHDDWVAGMLGAIVVHGTRGDSFEVSAIMIGLFLSMLPLHDDRPDRQNAFIANALRLYAEMEDAAG